MEPAEAYLAALPRAQPRRGGGAPPRPKIRNIRPIQFNYSESGGTVTCTWDITEGTFDKIVIHLDGGPLGDIPGNEPGTNLGVLSPGFHEIGIEGFVDGRGTLYETVHQVLTQSPVPEVEITRWTASGFHPSLKQGRLEIEWQNRHENNDPYVEYEFFVNGVFQGKKSALRESITFGQLDPGEYEIQIMAFTQNYTSLPASEIAPVRPLAGPTELECEVECEEDTIEVEISYEIPGGETYDCLAVWVLRPRNRVFLGLGCPPPESRRVTISNLPLAPVVIEIAGVLRVGAGKDCEIYSNLPGAPGEHAIATCGGDDGHDGDDGDDGHGGDDEAECIKRGGFLRGDVEPDGILQLTDAIGVLLYLFAGEFDPTCLDALDVNDDSEITVADPIRLLEFIFAGALPPAAPGPFQCGHDPTDDQLQDCVHAACHP